MGGSFRKPAAFKMMNDAFFYFMIFHVGPDSNTHNCNIIITISIQGK